VRDNEVANEKRIIEANNLGAFYIYVNKRITNLTNVGVIVNEHNVSVTDELEKTNIFNRYFASESVPDNDVTTRCITKLFWRVCLILSIFVKLMSYGLLTSLNAIRAVILMRYHLF